jgi:PAS domain S-box-containing protein/putative nucleotidyltransferase with HDIG domain
MKVLLVDDDPNGRQVLETLFSHSGWSVFTADNGSLALDIARGDPPDVVISDVLMPVMDGYLLCAEWHRDELLRDIPFIFITAAYTDPKDQEFGRSLGADRFLSKPLDPHTMVQTVVDVIEGYVPGSSPAEPRALDEPDLLREHNARLINRLEATVVELERANTELARYHLLFKHAHDLMLFVAADGTIIEANAAAATAYGISTDQLAGMPLREISTADLSARLAGMLTNGPGAAARIVTEHKRVGGSTFPVEFSVFTVEYAGELIILLVGRDITERKLAEEQLADSVEQMERTLYSIVNAMAKIVETRDPYTAGHQERVSNLSHAIAGKLGLPEVTQDSVLIAGLVHDIGKIYVPAEILTKPGRLTDIEFELIKSHAQVSFDILSMIDFPWSIAEIAHQHHERLDGSGYPQALKGDAILPESRILAVADVVEAMTFHRPYKVAQGLDKALEEIESGRGTRYDAAAVDACISLFTEDGFRFQGPDEGPTEFVRPRHARLIAPEDYERIAPESQSTPDEADYSK